MHTAGYLGMLMVSNKAIWTAGGRFFYKSVTLNSLIKAVKELSVFSIVTNIQFNNAYAFQRCYNSKFKFNH